jgi:hypothetical protein
VDESARKVSPAKPVERAAMERTSVFMAAVIQERRRGGKSAASFSSFEEIWPVYAAGRPKPPTGSVSTWNSNPAIIGLALPIAA